MSIKINTINVEPGDSFIINHGGRVEASLAIAALKDGIAESPQANGLHFYRSIATRVRNT